MCLNLIYVSKFYSLPTFKHDPFFDDATHYTLQAVKVKIRGKTLLFY